MLPISRILVPVDFSQRCLEILPYAKMIAARYDAELALLHVFNPVYTIPAAGPFGPVIIPLPTSVFRESVKRLDEFGADQLKGVRVRRLVYEGDPGEQIVAFTQSEDVQLIVMSTHGLGTLRRFLIGSVAAKVLHDVACPVLTGVHGEQRSQPKPVMFSSILCAVDLGTGSRPTLAWAGQFAGDFQARLGIVHVVASPDTAGVREELEKLQNAVGVKADTIAIKDGEVAAAVCSFANATGADLLVIGRGSHQDQHGRLRTNSYAIISQAPCPVISV
jgi:nucleotide-binding universal stress UspA family protein